MVGQVEGEILHTCMYVGRYDVGVMMGKSVGSWEGSWKLESRIWTFVKKFPTYLTYPNLPLPYPTLDTSRLLVSSSEDRKNR